MEARLEQWRMQKTNRTSQTRRQPTDKKKLPCSKELSSFKTQQKGQMSRSVPSSRRKQRSKQEDRSAQGQRSVLAPRSKQQDVHQCKETSSDLTMREKLEAWLVEKKKQMEFEKAQIKIRPWNSNKRKLAVSRLDWQPDTSFKLRDIVTSKYRGYYGQAKACKLTPGQLLCPVDTTQREAINLKENVMTKMNSVKMSLEEEGLEAIRVSSGDLIKCGDLQSTLVNENKTEKNRRARLEEWLVAKGKTLHTVKRNVRRETFDVIRLSPELEQCVQVDEDARLERSEVDVNCALDECLHSCLGFMNEVKISSIF
ncbi:uncharacterized protein LOC117108134 isoform X1 [Anneissia japonica]|uniref:uncharacterized protein LOC117108134 isoform X1 n=1 Tax=Anneissia japonica TaxID=1529436 RepID=UPI001425756C|nr:uncharacterized protein LOC117108134 isoform X1 [Anneissia japonica]